MIRRWTVRIAVLVDRAGTLPEQTSAIDEGLALFGVDRFRENQLEAVLTAMRGESMLVVRPTGSGKSLCYQLPAVIHGQPATFVLAPLKALMSDQVAGLQELKIPATFVNGDISQSEKEARYELLEAGSWLLFYAAPERFNPERVRPQEIERLSQQRPAFLVVDEAHLIDRWGPDFRVDYSRITEIRERLGNPPVLAFTATANLETQGRIKESLGIKDAATIVNDVDRPNIALIRVDESSDGGRAKLVADLIHGLVKGRALIFVPTTNVGREVEKAMADAGCPLPLYHGKLPAHERENLLGQLTGRTEPPLQAIICTSAFGMGIDISDVRLVVHWQHPASVEDYFQQFGRGGRDGNSAVAVLFTSDGDEAGLLSWMAQRTSEKSIAEGQRTPAESHATLAIREREIKKISDLSLEWGTCFRDALRQEMVGPETTQSRPLPLRILEWGFGSREKTKPGDGCCDFCDPELAELVRAGTYSPSTLRPPRRKRMLSEARGRGKWAAAAAAVVALAVIAVVVIATGTSSFNDSPSNRALASSTFVRYTGAFAKPGEFGTPVVAVSGEAYAVCGLHRRPGTADAGRYTLCLLVDTGLEDGRRVIGSYKRRGASSAKYSASDCRGNTISVPLCNREKD